MSPNKVILSKNNVFVSNNTNFCVKNAVFVSKIPFLCQKNRFCVKNSFSKKCPRSRISTKKVSKSPVNPLEKFQNHG